MGRRKPEKHTVVYKGFFGEKHIETQYGNSGGGCLGVIVIALLAWFFLRGCG